MESKARLRNTVSRSQDADEGSVGVAHEAKPRASSRRASAPATSPVDDARVRLVATEATQAATGQKKAKQDRPKQNLLVRALWSCMDRRGHSIHDLADALGVTYGYLLSIARGERPMNSVSRDILARAAEYLQIPLAQAYVWAGVLAPEDFYNSRSLAFELDALYEDLKNNTGLNFFLPTKEEWDNLPARPKLTIAIMYENLRGKFFLSHVDIAKEH